MTCEKEKRKMMEDMMIPSINAKSAANLTFIPSKLYHNPIFTHRPPHPQPPQQGTNKMASAAKKSRATALEKARAQIIESTAELELERKLRKKVECLAKKMAKELAEERRSREAAERLCDELEIRVSRQKAETDEIQREVEEERRMLKIAEVLREERVQMKLEDAKLFYEEKLIKLNRNFRKTGEEENPIKVAGTKSWVSENPHIKRGIKGFVEFPRGVRVVGSNRSDANYKIQCQKAQLSILLKQRNLAHPNTLAIT